MNSLRLKLLLGILTLTVLIIIQNSQIIKVNFLLWSYELPLLTLSLLILLVGIFLGYSFCMWLVHRKEASKVAPKNILFK